ncbi:imidazole glycerol phosphate synthase subunit HisH [Prosthecobacter vanneervenii]|uniref:Imidazole glycerol phosphate synthase subunit HisH n=1 Tax=Prosthecobacter vanneervenii TaxID=48466 RepID=A0A7W8DJA3_9BACT|nr:imidazole glycerol phosphate synthase subunit HisH [Prosthecobacter vanneervenii]MBB5031938.1 glutamine amidotransferase/cyclase/glutamine amidotransferase [Prosthecobacter vanneervenii]
MKLGVLDYGGGNLRSVLNAFDAIDAHADLVTKPEDFASIDVLVFPGQGAFGDSIRILKETGLWEPLQAWLKAEKPYLGICLGYQLLFESSEESPGVEGLCVAKGQVKKFDPASGLKIPHMGWNVAQWEPAQAAVWSGLPNPTHIYFVHSYYPDVQDESLALCRTDYGVSFISGIAKKNLVAVQFHPEKSQEAGLTLLRNSLQVLKTQAQIE